MWRIILELPNYPLSMRMHDTALILPIIKKVCLTDRYIFDGIDSSQSIWMIKHWLAIHVLLICQCLQFYCQYLLLSTVTTGWYYWVLMLLSCALCDNWWTQQEKLSLHWNSYGYSSKDNMQAIPASDLFLPGMPQYPLSGCHWCGHSDMLL